MSAQDKVLSLRLAMRDILQLTPRKHLVYYANVRNECDALIKARFRSRSSLVRNMANRWDDWTSEPPTQSQLEATLVLADEWKKRFEKLLKPFEIASVVWDILAQELQARNRRDCTVAALPGELASLIFDFLTLRDVTRCTFVCKDWFRLTVSTPHVWKKLIVRVRDQPTDRSTQLAGLLRRSEPLGLSLTLLLPRTTTNKMEQQHLNLLRVLPSCIASRSLVSLELHYTGNGGPDWAASLLRASAPQLQNLCLAIGRDASEENTAVVPDRPLSDSRPDSLALHFVHPHGLGRGPALPIPECFMQLNHLSLYTNLSCAHLGQALMLVFDSCQRLTDLTLLWITAYFGGRFVDWWTSPPASSALKRLRIVLQERENNVKDVIRLMRRNLPHLSVCIRANDWDRCQADNIFFCDDAQTIRLTAIFTEPVLPLSFRGQHFPPAPGVPSYARITFHNETRSGETFFLRTVDGGVSTAQGFILEKSRMMTAKPVQQLTELISVTIAEAFWDTLARSVGSMPLLKNLVILVASRQPGAYCVMGQPPQVQPILFSNRLAMADRLPQTKATIWQNDIHRWAPYCCICLALETLCLVQDPHFAKVTGERAVRIEAWQIAQFISHQLGWELQRHETMSGKLPLRLVLQRVEFSGRNRFYESQEILNHISIEDSYAPFIHPDEETRWDRPYCPEPQVWV